MSRITRSKVRKSEEEEDVTLSDRGEKVSNMADEKEPSLRDLLKEFKKNQEGNEKIQTQLNNIQTSVDTNTTTLQEHMKKYDSEIKEINSTLQNLQTTVTTLTDRIDTFTTEAEESKEENKLLRQRLHEVENIGQRFLRQEDDCKRRNIVIEKSFQKTKEEITELLTDLGIEMSPLTVINLHRLGKQVEGATYHRPVKVLFLSNLTKQLLFKNISNLKDNEKWKKVTINDDVTEEVKNIQRDLRCLAASARAKGLKAQQRGKVLVLEGQRYMYNEIDNLPHEISLENAKIVETPDGVAFQGKHAYLSNLSYSPFVYNGAGYRCAEQFIQIGRAMIAKDKRKEAKVRDTEDPYEMVSVGKQIKLDKAHDAAVYELVVKAAVYKFQQNPALLEKLKTVKGHIYEATKTKRWGCGLTIAQHSMIKHGETPDENLFGKVLENIRDTAVAGIDIGTCITNLSG